MKQILDSIRKSMTITGIFLVVTVMLSACEHKAQPIESPGSEASEEEILPSAVQVADTAPKLIEPAKSTYTIRLDSSAWVYYYSPWDSTLRTDSLLLYPNGNYLISRNVYYDYDYGEDRVRGKYRTNGDTLILSEPAGGYGFSYPKLLISDSKLRHIRSDFGSTPPNLHYVQDNEKVTLRRTRYRNNLSNFLSNRELVSLIYKVGSIEDLKALYGEPKNVTTTGYGEMNGTRVVVEYDSLVIHLNKTTIWLYEYTSNKYQLNPFIGIGTPMNFIYDYLGRPESYNAGMESYRSPYSKEIMHEFDTGDPSKPLRQEPVQLVVTFEYDDITYKVVKVRWSLVYFQPQ